jgi:hypothetical protein
LEVNCVIQARAITVSSLQVQWFSHPSNDHHDCLRVCFRHETSSQKPLFAESIA